MTPAVALLRVSGRGQRDGDGFDRQLEACVEAAAANGHYLSWVYRFDVSGKKNVDERKDISLVTDDILADDTRRIIYVEDAHRLARWYTNQELLILQLAKDHIHVIIASTGEDITAAMLENPTKKLIVQMLGIVSEWERSTIVKKLAHAREAQRRATGKCEGRKGYQEKAPEVLQMVSALVTYRWAWDLIACALNGNGHRTLSGKPFTASSVRAIYRRNGKA